MSRKVNTEVATLKVYKYKGVLILLRQVGGLIYEYLFVFKGYLYGHHWVITDTEKLKLDRKEQGGVVFLMANGAEVHVDRLRRKHILWVRLWYNLIARHFEVTVETPKELEHGKT